MRLPVLAGGSCKVAEERRARLSWLLESLMEGLAIGGGCLWKPMVSEVRNG